ncbi:hypothetical protein GYMLUDRAFT_266072 [Collybiopsis luxurians FD-317 M1]|uniref:Unplaced genomic scaffold GYMLUscaffold_137, whole genome shotgun sequence n=1 Tax=Collybiopsis luxurians FD-317 M1 TaxID=944289 RepID=A0A0D0AKM9_9AGAR|nr:hypothetical protein GYMLUDRAFT_266072 [Collybiopsis luxurians FD-317 M1]
MATKSMLETTGEHVKAAFEDPRVILYSQDFALRLLEGDVQIAEEEPSVEHRLYSLINRIISDLCLIAQPKQEKGKANSSPSARPGIFWLYNSAAMVFHIPSRTLRPAFWIEGKPLSQFAKEPFKAWRADLDSWRFQAFLLFESAVEQVLEQAQFAFRSFEGDEHQVIILIGILWSLLTFTREKEEKMRKLELGSFDYNTPDKKRGIKRRRDSSQGEKGETDLEKIMHNFDSNLQSDRRR